MKPMSNAALQPFEEADRLFFEDATKLGYDPKDAHVPGNGRGVRAYYRDHGMIPPGAYAKVGNAGEAREVLGIQLDSSFSGGRWQGVDLVGRPAASSGRHTQPMPGLD